MNKKYYEIQISQCTPFEDLDIEGNLDFIDFSVLGDLHWYLCAALARALSDKAFPKSQG